VPPSPLTASVATPLASFTTLTVEPGMAPPDESRTTPVIARPVACARLTDGVSSAATIAATCITLPQHGDPSPWS
jgi:hypothetical protein